MRLKPRQRVLLEMRKMLIFDVYKFIDVLKTQILKNQEGFFIIEDQVIERKSA